jgi:hypothetical protein
MEEPTPFLNLLKKIALRAIRMNSRPFKKVCMENLWNAEPVIKTPTGSSHLQTLIPQYPPLKRSKLVESAMILRPNSFKVFWRASMVVVLYFQDSRLLLLARIAMVDTGFFRTATLAPRYPLEKFLKLAAHVTATLSRNGWKEVPMV